jgi:hypothetical protein
LLHLIKQNEELKFVLLSATGGAMQLLIKKRKKTAVFSSCLADVQVLILVVTATLYTSHFQHVN